MYRTLKCPALVVATLASIVSSDDAAGQLPSVPRLPAASRDPVGVRRAPVIQGGSLVATGGALSPRGRLARAEERVAVMPASYEARWNAARDYTEVALSETEADTAEELLRRAWEHATMATELDPAGIDGHYWLGVAAGGLADVTGGREKVRFGDQVHRESTWVLEQDSLHAGAHYLQGRVHAGVMRLSSVTRFLAKLIVGGDALAAASWERAEYHLRRAAELRPELAMHHFELAMVYRAMDRPAAMERALRAALGATASTPFQDEFKARARELLGDGEGRPRA